jgi:prepilin-type N-terminal cleavage/methylation domain-containing protein
MMTWRQHLRGQRGDTIVEVLIAIAVISLVLGGAYVTTNRSLQATRSAQERGNALKLAETQMEQIKGLAATDPTALFSAPSPFCIRKTDSQPVAATDAACRVNLSGDQAGSNEQPSFRISILRDVNDFTLTETWDDVSGRQSNTLQLRYRVYE